MEEKLSKEKKAQLLEVIGRLLQLPFYKDFLWSFVINENGKELMQLRVSEESDSVLLTSDSPQVFEIMIMCSSICEKGILDTIKSVTQVKLHKISETPLENITSSKETLDTLIESSVNEILNSVNPLLAIHNQLDFFSSKKDIVAKFNNGEKINFEDLCFSVKSKPTEQNKDNPNIHFQSPEVIDVLTFVKGIEVGSQLMMVNILEQQIQAVISNPDIIPEAEEYLKGLRDDESEYIDALKSVSKHKGKETLN